MMVTDCLWKRDWFFLLNHSLVPTLPISATGGQCETFRKMQDSHTWTATKEVRECKEQTQHTGLSHTGQGRMAELWRETLRVHDTVCRSWPAADKQHLLCHGPPPPPPNSIKGTRCWWNANSNYLILSGLLSLVILCITVSFWGSICISVTAAPLPLFLQYLNKIQQNVCHHYSQDE
jgi:hypothetical protein